MQMWDKVFVRNYYVYASVHNCTDNTIPEDFCSRILEFDKNIRFAGVADKFGKMVMAEYRKGVVLLLSDEESTLSVVQSSIRMGTRKALQPVLGKKTRAKKQPVIRRFEDHLVKATWSKANVLQGQAFRLEW